MSIKIMFKCVYYRCLCLNNEKIKKNIFYYACIIKNKLYLY